MLSLILYDFGIFTVFYAFLSVFFSLDLLLCLCSYLVLIDSGTQNTVSGTDNFFIHHHLVSPSLQQTESLAVVIN